MSQKRVKGLKESAAKKRKKALQKTEEAINSLIENRQKITVSSVAKLAGVSTSYIYKYPELAYKIQTLREQQKYETDRLLSAANKHYQLTKKSGDRAKDWQQEKAKLTEEIKTLNSSIEHIINSGNSVEQLQANNVKLTLENEKLKQQLERLEQEVYQLRGVVLNRGYVEDRNLKDETNPKQRIIQEILK